MRVRQERRRSRAAQQQAQAQQQQAEVAHQQKIAELQVNYNNATASCMSGRQYSVN
jgi:hypothetical protein